MEFVLVAIYILSLFFIFMFSLGQLHLTWHYLRSKKNKTETIQLLSSQLPVVTIQLPIYNERYVVARLLQSVSEIDYPKEKLDIQVLDDSTDETTEIIAEKIAEIQKPGFTINHIRRQDRVGFKAGALQHGLELGCSEFIAIFDADFIPKPNFLTKTLPHFANKKVGMVQTRWGHINKNYSLLTKLQAFGLDAHFSVEQSGRNFAKSFINFNGTAGIWRKKTILDAGGWSADTLTEDLDLSYRAQIKGWDFKYMEDVVSPAELPILMSAVKSQQYRWNKGAAETARKNLGQVFRSDLSVIGKLHALFHLLNSSVFVFVFIASLCSIPMLYIKESNPGFTLLFNIGSIFLIGFFSIAFYYWVACKNMYPNNKQYYFTIFPKFLSVSMGLSLHNSIAVIEGILGFKTPFIRTPKFNVAQEGDSWKHNVYVVPKLTWQIVTEGLLSLYFLFGIVSGFILHDWGLLLFHSMLCLGFAWVAYHSIKPVLHA